MIQITFRCETCLKKFIVNRNTPRRYCSTHCQPRPKRHKKHDGYGTRLYQTWTNIKSRCFNNSRPDYPYYGGRGIVVCDEWKDSFVAFQDWANANGYSDNLTIDRKDTNGNYEPDNCRWVSHSRQCQNRRKQSTSNSQYKGVYKSRKSWVAYLRLNGKMKHIGCFANEIEAAKAYDAAAKEHYKEFAHLNFNQ